MDGVEKSQFYGSCYTHCRQMHYLRSWSLPDKARQPMRAHKVRKTDVIAGKFRSRSITFGMAEASGMKLSCHIPSAMFAIEIQKTPSAAAGRFVAGYAPSAMVATFDFSGASRIAKKSRNGCNSSNGSFVTIRAASRSAEPWSIPSASASIRNSS